MSNEPREPSVTPWSGTMWWAVPMVCGTILAAYAGVGDGSIAAALGAGVGYILWPAALVGIVYLLSRAVGRPMSRRAVRSGVLVLWAIGLPLSLLANVHRSSLSQSVLDAGSGCRVVFDMCMPFPGQPERTREQLDLGVLGTTTIENYTYAPTGSHIQFAALVYSGLPSVADPPASILRGFTRGHAIRMERALEVNGIQGFWVTSEADSPVPSVWNAFAFEYRRRVYLWLETFELSKEIGDELDVFRARLTYLTPR